MTAVVARPASSPGQNPWLQVQVRSGQRAVDLVLCATATPADLIPDLAQRLGHRDPSPFAAGVVLQVAGRGPLTWDLTLREQGVGSGAVLLLEPTPEPELVHDDVVEALAALTAATAPSPDQGRQMVAAAAAATMLIGALTLLSTGPALGSALTVLALAAAMALTARSLTLRPQSWVAPSAPAGLAVALGCVGLLLAPVPSATPILRAGVAAGALIAVGAGLVILPGVRSVGAACASLGLALGAGVVAVGIVGCDPVDTLLVLAVLVAALTDVVPRAGLVRRDDEPAGTRWNNRWLAPAADDVSAATDLWTGAAAARCLVLWTAAWWGQERGVLGLTAVVVAALAAHLLNSSVAVASVRRWSVATLVGTIGVSCLYAVAHHPSWTPTVAAVLAIGGGLMATRDLVPSTRPMLRERVAEAAGGALLVALVPVTLLALGAQGWVGR